MTLSIQKTVYPNGKVIERPNGWKRKKRNAHNFNDWINGVFQVTNPISNKLLKESVK